MQADKRQQITEAQRLLKREVHLSKWKKILAWANVINERIRLPQQQGSNPDTENAEWFYLRL